MGYGYTVVKVKQDTRDNWHRANPVLFERELGVDTTFNVVKVGNGKSAWMELPVAEHRELAKALAEGIRV